MRKLLILLAILCSSVSGYAIGDPTIGGVKYVVDTLEHYKVGPGTTYTRMHFIHQRSPLWVYFFEVETDNQYVKIQSETSTDILKGMERISSIAARKTSEKNTYFAAINGDFYNTKTGEPSHGFITRGSIGKIPSTNPSVFFENYITPFIGVTQFSGEVKTSSASLLISQTNMDRGADQLVVYNYLRGAKTETNIYGTELLLELENGDWLLNSGTKKAKVVKKEVGIGNMAIPANQVVLSGNGSAKTFLDGINENDVIELTLDVALNTEPGTKRAITGLVGGDRLMLKDGQLAGENWADLHPRTGIGFNSDKSKIYFAVVDGRGVSVGVTTHTFGEIMRFAGASDAMNLDGGGSSGMYLEKYGIVNVGSDGYERSVSNGLFAVSSAPTDNTIAALGFMKSYYELPIYATMKPTIVGYNQYGHIVNVDVPATFSCPASLGSVGDRGFSAGGQTTLGNLKATYNGVSVEVPVHVVDAGSEVAITLDSVLVDTRREYLIDIKSFFNENEFPIDPKVWNWTVLNPSVCSVNDGIVKGLSRGSSLVIGELGAKKDTLLVKVEPIEDNPYIQTDFTDVENFDFSASTANLTGITVSKDNLPEGWSHGASLSYQYTKDRYSALNLKYLKKLYSLPDSMVITLKPGSATFSKMTMSILANNENVVRALEGTGLELGKESEFGFNLKKFFPNDDLAYFPINLLDINFALQDAKHSTGKTYDVYLKDIKLFYGGYTIGIDELVSESGRLFITPNPVKNGEAILNFSTETGAPFKVEIYTLSGKLTKIIEFGDADSQQHILPVHDLVRGVYLVSVSQKGGVNETVKMIVE